MKNWIWLCHFFHNWSRWVSESREDSYLTRQYQRRICHRCGYVKEESI